MNAAGDERSGMAVVAEPQMHQIQHGGRAGGARERFGIALRALLEIFLFDRHRMALRPRNGRAPQQVLFQMRPVALAVTGRRRPLVDLQHVQCVPRQRHVG